MLRLLSLVFLAFSLSGCATSSFEVLDINALSSNLDNNGSFKGLERIAEKAPNSNHVVRVNIIYLHGIGFVENPEDTPCLLYTSPSPRDGLLSRMPSSA